MLDENGGQVRLRLDERLRHGAVGVDLLGGGADLCYKVGSNRLGGVMSGRDWIERFQWEGRLTQPIPAGFPEAVATDVRIVAAHLDSGGKRRPIAHTVERHGGALVVTFDESVICGADDSIVFTWEWP